MKGTPVRAWRTLDAETGAVETVRLSTSRRRGRRLSVKGLHSTMLKMVKRPAPRGSVRLIIGTSETEVAAGGAPRSTFPEAVDRHAGLLARRGKPQSAEDWPPIGQAAWWHADVVGCVPRSGQLVARQLARLCSEDSQVTVPARSLADAVGQRDAAGHQRGFTERGIQCLTDSGWLAVEVLGTGQNIATTYRLMPGDRFIDYYLPDDDAAWTELEDEL